MGEREVDWSTGRGIVWRVFWIDSSMELIEFSSSFDGSGDQKHLVESCGELYLVDRYAGYRQCLKTTTFEVYKLDQEWDLWVQVKNLGDQVFILGKDSSFSVSATEFSGCRGNCIYFTDKNDIGVFYLENQKTGKIVDFQDQCHLFRPPPSWLS